MDPKAQVDAIIVLLNPEAAGTQDAVFLVQKYITDTNAKISGLQKAIAVKEAELEAKAKEVHDERNARLVDVQREKKIRDDLVAAGEIPIRAKEGDEGAPKPGPGKGKTL